MKHAQQPSALELRGLTKRFDRPAVDALDLTIRVGEFYALDARNGTMLWKTALGGQVASGPITYRVDGRQYVAVAAGHALFVFTLRQ